MRWRVLLALLLVTGLVHAAGNDPLPMAMLAYYESFGFLDKAAGAPMPKDAIFALASMTAVAALMLAERGELLLNDPIGNYLPVLKDMKVATTTGTEPAITD